MHLEIPVTEGEQYRVGEVEVRGPDRLQGGVRPPPLQAGDGRRLQRVAASRRATTSCATSTAARATSSGRRGPKRKPDPERKVVDVTLRHGRGQALLRGPDPLHRQRHHARQGDPARGLPERGRRLQHRGPQALDPAHQPARLLQADGGRRPSSAPSDAGRRQARRHLQGGGAEPQPVHLRRRRVAAWRGRSSTRPSPPRTSWALGETFQVSAQSGRRTKNYQIAITEPYLFDRPITAGLRHLQAARSPTRPSTTWWATPRRRTGVSLIVGLPLGRFSRVFTNYSYEVIKHRAASRPAGVADPDEPDARPARLRSPLLRRGRASGTESRLHALARAQHGRQPLHAAQRA